MKTLYYVKLHRCNPKTRFCDNSGKLSGFYSSLSLKALKASVSFNFKQQLKINPQYDLFDFDRDVYFVEVLNCNTHKNHTFVM